MTSSPVVPQPRRGDVYDFNPDPVIGRELGHKTRPGVIISNDNFNRGQSGLVVIVPTTTTIPRIPNPLLVAVQPPEGGFESMTVIRCDNVRSISTNRLATHRGRVSPQTVAAIEQRLRVLLGL